MFIFVLYYDYVRKEEVNFSIHKSSQEDSWNEKCHYDGENKDSVWKLQIKLIQWY